MAQDLVIWDLDGTLFHTETATVPAVQQAFAEMDLPQPAVSAIQACFGGPTSEFHAWLGSQCSTEQASELFERVDQLEFEFIAKTGRLYDGVLRTLTQIQARGFQMAICTNAYFEYAAQVLRAHDLGSFFMEIQSWSRSGDEKSVMVATLLMNLNPRRAVVVGDRIHDIEAAQHNGLPVIAARYGYGSPDELQKADRIAGTPAEIPAMVLDLLQDAD